MTRRATALNILAPAATASLNPTLLRRLNAHAGDYVVVESRRGSIRLVARADGAVPEDAVFIPSRMSRQLPTN